jgi:hypothetical protein
MPIGSDPQFEEKMEAIGKVIRKSGREPIFPSYTPEPSAFYPDVFVKELNKVQMVIADLTLERPSCYYELGLVEGARKRVHIFAKTGTPIHQCGGRTAVLFYNDIADLVDIIESVLMD